MQYFVHVTAEYVQVSDIENVIVADGPVYLKDVAKVFFGVKEEESISRVNGLDAVSIMLVVTHRQTSSVCRRKYSGCRSQ